MTDIGFIGLRPTKVPKSGRGSGRKVMKPGSELNPKVWQSDCLLGIDQKRSEMFRSCRAGGLVLGAGSIHSPENTARHPLPTPPRFPAGANCVHRGRAIALTNGDGPNSFLPRSGLVIRAFQAKSGSRGTRADQGADQGVRPTIWVVTSAGSPPSRRPRPVPAGRSRWAERSYPAKNRPGRRLPRADWRGRRGCR